jgi:mannonate dehydratase
MQLSMVLPPEPDDRWDRTKQVGVTGTVYHALELGDGHRPHEFDDLLRIVSRYRDHGLEPVVFEGSVPLTGATRLGLEGREAELDRFCTMLENLGELGVEVVCYD